ncbi:YagK/YfjJ domain-containing protein, partial [Escherichia coli]|uniref:YagK/YfjJ domain-containing protein n=1 Tax=Escherichia coli TaxID=562 RepID=UPI0020188D7F
PRLTALRVDLRFPDVPAATDAAVISRFINALKARIDAYQKRKHREGKRVHPTTLHYVWAREFGECKGKKHYHLMLLVNRETQVNPQCRQAGMNIQCVPHRLTNTLLPEGVVFVGHG